MIRYCIWATALTALSVAATDASPLCRDFTASADELDLIYLDLPDPLTERVAQPLEADLLRSQIDKTTPGPLQKIYCRIGMFEMQLRFVQPVEDDAVAAVVTEATYGWDATQDPAGWVLSRLRRQAACARGAATFADICP